MPKSMTGFGRSVVDAPFGRLIVEIQSVNRKHFEVSLHLPKELFRFENEIRKWLRAKVFRGHLSLRLQVIPFKEAIGFPDAELLKSVKTGWEGISKELGLDPKDVNLSFITAVMPQVEKKDLFEDDGPLKKCVEDALQNLLSMREEEGKALVEDILQRMQEIQKKVSSIEKLSPDASGKMREKLTEKMNALFTPDQSIEDRLLKEIALFAEKIDVSEELIRLKAHFGQLESCLKAEGSVGRKMEFVLQEISREINTIGSKSLDAKIAHLVVETKSEIEKIREQIQNIE